MNQFFNKDIRQFFLKLIILVIVWELAYYFLLKPVRVPDKLLTDIIAAGVTWCFNLASKPSSYIWMQYQGVPGDYIFLNGKAVLLIADICNALNLIVIYIGFIILMPYYSFKRKLIFGLSGIIGLIVADIIRCGLLYWIYRKNPQAFDLNHHYVFSVAMYLLIFAGWALFIQGKRTNEVG